MGVPGTGWLKKEHVDAFQRWYEAQSRRGSVSPDDIAMFRKHTRMVAHLQNRYLFRTSKGYIGVTAREISPTIGDSVFLIPTASQSFIMRSVGDPANNVYKLISSAHLQGMQKRPKMVEDNYWFSKEDANVHPHAELGTYSDTIWLV